MSVLRPAAEGASLIVCNTCRHSADAREDAEGVRGGARMAAALRTAQDDDARLAELSIEEMPCLFACQDFCTPPYCSALALRS